MENISKEAINNLKNVYNKGLVEVSTHSMTDDITGLLYVKYTGKDYPKEELKKNFSKVDKIYEKWGIKQAKTVNAHMHAFGKGCLPFLRERDIKFLMVVPPFGEFIYPDSCSNSWSDWEPKPYGNKTWFLDTLPKAEDFFCVGAFTKNFDFLSNSTIFRNENRDNDLEKSAIQGANQIAIGLDGLFFGCLTTHEQRITAMSKLELDNMLGKIDKLIDRYPKIYASYDYIAKYAKAKFFSRITSIKIDKNKIYLEIESNTEFKNFLCMEK